MARLIKKSKVNTQNVATMAVVALVAVIAGGVIMIANNTSTPKLSNRAAEPKVDWASGNQPNVSPTPTLAMGVRVFDQPNCYATGGCVSADYNADCPGGSCWGAVGEYNAESMQLKGYTSITFYTQPNYQGTAVTMNATNWDFGANRNTFASYRLGSVCPVRPECLWVTLPPGVTHRCYMPDKQDFCPNWPTNP
jgi:hypothetical protein